MRKELGALRSAWVPSSRRRARRTRSEPGSRAELRPFLQAPAAAGRGRGCPVTGADAAGERRLRAAAVLLAPNHAQGMGG